MKPDVVMPTPIPMKLQSHCGQQRAQEDARMPARRLVEEYRNRIARMCREVTVCPISILPQKHASISKGPLRQAQDAPQQLGNPEQTRGCAGAEEGMRDTWPIKCSGPASRDPRGRASPLALQRWRLRNDDESFFITPNRVALRDYQPCNLTTAQSQTNCFARGPAENASRAQVRKEPRKQWTLFSTIVRCKNDLVLLWRST